MGVMRKLSSLKCKVRIIEARNVEVKSEGKNSNLFVRFYLSSGHKLNTYEISSRSENLVWDQSFGLECQGEEEAVKELKQQRVVFELRKRKTSSFLGNSSRSELVGRGEVSWKSVFESQNMEIERFVEMGQSKNRVLENGKPILLKVVLKVEALTMEKEKKKRFNEFCDCRNCGSCKSLDYEAFVLACGLECI